MSKVLVIGGGAAGMMAAIAAAKDHHAVILLEKNEKLGKKLYITGKGRCNVTNFCERDDFFRNVVSNPRFLYSSFDGYSNYDLIADLEEWGLPLKYERGNRVFPDSDKSSDVIRTLQKQMEKCNVKVRLNTEVKELLIDPESMVCHGVLTKEKEEIKADVVIVATGGISYPSTGSTGDGFRFAKKAGHTVTSLYPSLVALRCKEELCKKLQGVSLKNISVRIFSRGDEKGEKKPIYEEFGEMLFTHFGISGPIILTASSLFAKEFSTGEHRLLLDFKPALTKEQLDKRLLQNLAENHAKTFRNAVSGFLPERLLDVVFETADLDGKKHAGEVSREDREKFIGQLKGLPLTITGLCGYNEAIITKGGISVKEINPSTMDSKKIKGLKFAGEVLDLDAFTGGFNLQIAFSTGHAAGSHC